MYYYCVHIKNVMQRCINEHFIQKTIYWILIFSTWFFNSRCRDSIASLSCPSVSLSNHFWGKISHLKSNSKFLLNRSRLIWTKRTGSMIALRVINDSQLFFSGMNPFLEGMIRTSIFVWFSIFELDIFWTLSLKINIWN